MNRLLVIFAIVLLALNAAFFPSRAHAIAGGFTGNLPVLVIGAVAAAGGGTLLVMSGTGHYRGLGEGVLEVLAGVGLAVAGLVMLDDEDSGHALAFSPLQPQGAARLGITPEEAKSYNAELPEINAIRESVQGEALFQHENGRAVRVRDLHRLWMSYRDLISPEAFSALEKVSTQVSGT